ncbi:hypothetical protein [Synoicihabitans lomoniglobus]|uniref:Uncharacterized protein n=1 Tax=Synoicihabitans lomoniglobus TaxID=2909285 RepID=A0AAE9ZQW1_9BACT|nr:hypothetical protein [Opitutaceae bacterium LMO-M01]WED63480.1 hypothetical protein PXH66_14160 [Opitutaceae bacterium LMO-M01]
MKGRSQVLRWSLTLAIASVVRGDEDSVLAKMAEVMPVYNPPVQESVSEEETVYPSHQERPRLRSIPPRKTREVTYPPRAPDVETEREVVQLPEVTVETTQLPTVELPRLEIKPPKKNVEIEPFLTGEALAEKLVEKHLSAFDRLVLNRFTIPLLGSSLQQRAREAEAREQFAKAMNEIATGIEQAKVWGVSDEEQEALREEYYRLLMTRPR